MAEQQLLPLQLREYADFSSFVAGPNALVLDQLHALAHGQLQDQLFIWGGPGSGKTHLLEATVREAAEQGHQSMLLSASMLCQCGPALLDELAISGLLAVDDVDQLLEADNAVWSEALFHLYNRCRLAGSALLFSAVTPPAGLDITLADLASRLGAGQVYQLQPLQEEALRQVLVARAAARGLTLGKGVADFVLRRMPRQPGELVAVLNRLEKAALRQQRLITIPLVKQELEV